MSDSLAAAESALSQFKWRPYTSSSYHAEHMVVGTYELIVVQKHVGSEEAPTLWDVFGPPGHSDLLRTGITDNFNAAKAAAEKMLAALRKP